MARQEDGRLTYEQCDEIRLRVQSRPLTLQEIAGEAEHHRLARKNMRDSIREKTQHPNRHSRRTASDLETAEKWLRWATVVADHFADLLKQRPGEPPLQPEQSPEPERREEEPFLDL